MSSFIFTYSQLKRYLRNQKMKSLSYASGYEISKLCIFILKVHSDGQPEKFLLKSTKKQTILN